MANGVVQFNRELAEKEKAVVRMQKANEIANEKIKQFTEQVQTLQNTVTNLERAADDKEASYQAGVATIQTQLEESERQRERLSAVVAQFNNAVDEKLAAKDKEMDNMKLSRANFEKVAAAEREELEGRLERLTRELAKRHASEMLWLQSLWGMKEKMTAEQLLEANETIQMMSEDFRTKIGGLGSIGQEWELKFRLQTEELTKSQAELQKTASELTIKNELNQSLSVEVAAEQALVSELNEKLKALQLKAQVTETDLKKQLQNANKQHSDEKRQTAQAFQKDLADMLAEQSNLLEKEQQLTATANEKARECKELLEAAENRANLASASVENKQTALDTLKTRFESSRTQYEKKLDQTSAALAMANEKTVNLRNSARSLNSQIDALKKQVAELQEQLARGSDAALKHKTALQSQQGKNRSLEEELNESKSNCTKVTAELEKANDTILMLSNQATALDGCVDLQEKHIRKLLEKLRVHSEEVVKYREQIEKFDADLKLAEAQSGNAMAEAEHAEITVQHLDDRNKRTEAALQRLEREQRKTKKRLRESNELLEERNGEVNLLKEMLNSLKIQAGRKGRSRKVSPSKPQPPPEGRSRYGHNLSRQSRHTHTTVPGPSRSSTPLLLPDLTRPLLNWD